MKIKNIVAKSFVLVSMVFGLASCGPEEPVVEPILHNVTFMNGNTVMQTTEVEEGTFATYTGATPTKESTVDTVYTFRCWDRSPKKNPIYKDTVFNALFKESVREYKVEFVAHGDVLQTSYVKYGGFAEYELFDPAEEIIEGHRFMFEGWDKDPRATRIYEDTTFTAQYGLLTFKIRFEDDEGNLYEEHEVEYGETPEYTWNTPYKPCDEDGYQYVFLRWSEQILPATCDMTYRAIFKKVILKSVVEDFESYTSDNEIANEWKVTKYDNGSGTWVSTSATVSRGFFNEGEGSLQSGLFKLWINGNVFKYTKQVSSDVSAKALQFSLLARQEHEVVVRLNVSVGGQSAYFDYHLNGATQYGEYNRITIPFDDPNWSLYGNAAYGNIYTALYDNTYDLPQILNSIEFIFKGSVDNGPDTTAYIDNIQFVSEYSKTLTVEKLYKRVAGYSMQDVKILFVDKDNLDIYYQGNKVKTIPYHYYVNDEYVGVYSSIDMNLELRGEVHDEELIITDSNTALVPEGSKLSQITMVDNFEGLPEGKLYSQQSGSQQTRYGMRANYWCDYRPNGSGNTYYMMGGTYDQLKLKVDGSNHYACMKSASSNGMRYTTYGLMDGGNSRALPFKGSKLTFRAYSKDGAKIELYFHIYYKSTNDGSSRTSLNQQYITNSSWQTYSIDLDATKTYYGISIYLAPNWNGDRFLYVDDIMVGNYL